MYLPSGYNFRKLEASDFSNNYLETLKTLTTVGNISETEFLDLFNHWSSLSDIYQPHVITNEEGTVVATGMLLLERKVIHQCGIVGHIEDISVSPSEQGKQLGKSMIAELTNLAHSLGCYKLILDCSPHNVEFYKKCGYRNAGIEMDKRF